MSRGRRARAGGALRGGVLLAGTLGGVALLSRVWLPDPAGRMHLAARLKPPLTAGLLGSDAYGRDILSQLMAGAWTSLSTAVPAVTGACVLGVTLGVVGATRGGWLDETVARSGDVLFAFPAVIAALMLTAVIGPGQGTAILAIGLFAIPVFLRVARNAALQAWAQDYCTAVRAMGAGRLRIVLRHVLPNIAGLVAVQASLQLGLAILAEAGLSFLGLGAPPPVPSWGRMLSEAQTYLGVAPWMAIAPGLAIGLAVWSFNLIGEGLRDWLDPRRHGSGWHAMC